MGAWQEGRGTDSRGREEEEEEEGGLMAGQRDHTTGVGPRAEKVIGRPDTVKR